MFFNPPALPDISSATRQITCIRCEQVFVVADDAAGTNPEQLQQANIALFFEVDRAVQPVSSPPTASLRKHPQIAPTSSTLVLEQPPSSQTDNQNDNTHTSQSYINCPRCGADNRNWVKMLQGERAKDPFFSDMRRKIDGRILFGLLVSGLASISYLATEMATELTLPNKILLTFIATLITTVIITFSTLKAEEIFASEDPFIMGGVIAPLAAFAGFLALLVRNPDNLWTQAVLFSLFFYVGGVLPSISLSHEWIKVLKNHRLRTHLPPAILKTTPIQNPLARTALTLVLVLAVVVPLLIYYGFPLLVSVLFGPLDNDLRPNADPKITALQTELDEWLSDAATAEEIRTVLTTLNDALDDALNGSVSGAELGLAIAYLETAVSQDALAESDIKNSLDDYLDGLNDIASNTTSHRFVLIWILAVGTITSFSSFIAYGAIHTMAKEADRQLPRPIYHSIADMTRIVAWEARIALEIARVDTIQWTQAARNPLGGITLRGIDRDTPLYNADGSIRTEYVRAQRYIIESDKWGRIISARLGDTTAPIALRTPAFVVANPSQINGRIPINQTTT